MLQSLHASFPSPSGVAQSGGLCEMGQGWTASAGREREKLSAWRVISESRCLSIPSPSSVFAARSHLPPLGEGIAPSLQPAPFRLRCANAFEPSTGRFAPFSGDLFPPPAGKGGRRQPDGRGRSLRHGAQCREKSACRLLLPLPSSLREATFPRWGKELVPLALGPIPYSLLPISLFPNAPSAGRGRALGGRRARCAGLL